MWAELLEELLAKLLQALQAAGRRMLRHPPPRACPLWSALKRG